MDRPCQRYFGLHPFIEAHPEAVFIKRTDVPVQTDVEAKKRAGYELATEVLTLQETPGIPLSHRIAIKPNQTLTDPAFVEGMIEGMKAVGLSADTMYLREGNWLGDGSAPHREENVYDRIAERSGIHFTDFPSGRTLSQLTCDTLEAGSEVTWVDCPDGVVFKRIGYVAPFNQLDTWLLNIAKFKAHGMGLTLCCKNQQGICIPPHIRFCEGVTRTKTYPDPILNDFQPEFEQHVEQRYAQHVAAGVPRWDRPGKNGGFWMETWAQRTCDNLSVTKTGLCIVEGLEVQPEPGMDVLANILIFGQHPLHVDIIGHWLGGHEPGNLGFFHCARGRGLCTVMNPAEIPVYRWEHGEATQTRLADVERIPLLTTYLCRDYAGQHEPMWHLVNEPFDYDTNHGHG